MDKLPSSAPSASELAAEPRRCPNRARADAYESAQLRALRPSVTPLLRVQVNRGAIARIAPSRRSFPRVARSARIGSAEGPTGVGSGTRLVGVFPATMRS